MKQVFLLVTILFLSHHLGTAQQYDSASFYRWTISQEAGIYIPTSKWRTGEITDELVSMREPASYWNFLNVSYNFKKNWGLNLSYHMAAVGDNNRGSKISSFIEQEYSNDYYFIQSNNYLDRENKFMLENISRFTFGIFYRKTAGKFVLKPSLSIGLTSFVSDHQTDILKEKGTNHIYKITMGSTAEFRAREYFTIAPSFIIVRPISKRFDIYAQASYFISSYDFAYEIKQENVYDSTSTSRIIPYKGPLHTLSFGLGIQYSFRKIIK